MKKMGLLATTLVLLTIMGAAYAATPNQLTVYNKTKNSVRINVGVGVLNALDKCGPDQNKPCVKTIKTTLKPNATKMLTLEPTHFKTKPGKYTGGLGVMDVYPVSQRLMGPLAFIPVTVTVTPDGNRSLKIDSQFPNISHAVNAMTITSLGTSNPLKDGLVVTTQASRNTQSPHLLTRVTIVDISPSK